GGGGYRGGGGWGGGSYDRAAAAAKTRPKTEWANRVSGQVRDNGDLELAAGDRIKHVDFGEGTVSAVTGQGAKRIAEIAFDSAGRKKLLIKIAPIEKL
ncbi:MAG: ATP-dependent DNA helicase PcrA, partial [Curtobacterium sp.]